MSPSPPHRVQIDRRGFAEPVAAPGFRSPVARAVTWISVRWVFLGCSARMRPTCVRDTGKQSQEGAFLARIDAAVRKAARSFGGRARRRSLWPGLRTATGTITIPAAAFLADVNSAHRIFSAFEGYSCYNSGKRWIIERAALAGTVARAVESR